MAPPLLILRDIELGFGGAPLLHGAELFVSEGERLCLVGRNGCGKSSLLKIAAGVLEADRGERFLEPSKTLRYLPQEPDLTGFPSTLAAVVRSSQLTSSRVATSDSTAGEPITPRTLAAASRMSWSR